MQCCFFTTCSWCLMQPLHSAIQGHWATMMQALEAKQKLQYLICGRCTVLNCFSA